jgi:hypothetical protein
VRLPRGARRRDRQDIARLVPTTGDAFTMVVMGETFDERRTAGRALMKAILTRLQLGEEGAGVIATIGGFDLDYAGERVGRGDDGYRYAIMLRRAGADDAVELPMTVTPLGSIARLEHALGGFEEERE